MSKRRFSDAREILNDLLSRREAKPSAVTLQTQIDLSVFGTVGEQDLFVALLEDMASRGAVTLVYRRIDGIHRLHAVRLAEVDAAYGWLGRTPSAEVARRSLAPLQEIRSLSACHASIIDSVFEGWSRGVRVIGLKPGQTGQLAAAMALADGLAIRARSVDLSQIDVRTFSRNTCGDSKALKDNAATVLAVLRQVHPDLPIESGIEAAELFASWGVEAMPHPLLLSGRFQMDDRAVPALDYIGFPPEQVDRLMLAGRPDYVLTIENQASFMRHAREINRAGTGLVIYTGGFPSRAVLHAIVSLASRAGAPTFHWGDLDAGGVRIFLHLEDRLAAHGISLRPHLMESDRLTRSGAAASSAKAVHAPPGSAIADLALLVSGAGALALEQEAISPCSPPCGPMTSVS